MKNIEHSYTRYLIDGDTAVLDDLLAAARRIALSVANRLGSDDPEEIAQEASVIVWQRLRDYDPSRGSLSTWIGTIVRRLVIDQYRVAPPRVAVLDETTFPPAPEVGVTRIDISYLPDEDRRTLAIFIRDQDLDSAAQTLGITVPTLRKRLTRIAAKNKSPQSVPFSALVYV
jgi:DNA-directed RNA polymerase specialized sigma24 family protein